MKTTSLPFPRYTVSAFFAASLGFASDTVFSFKALIDDDDDEDIAKYSSLLKKKSALRYSLKNNLSI